MSIDLNQILPLINATGIPLLAVSLIVLIMAYQKAVQTYKETASSLNEENKRLRETLHSNGLDYIEELRKMKKVVSKVDDAVENLVAAKATLLARGSADLIQEKQLTEGKKIFMDVGKIDLAIESMHSLIEYQSMFERAFTENQLRVEQTLHEFRANFRNVQLAISKLSDQIADNNSRALIVGVIGSRETRSELQTIAATQPKGLPMLEGLPSLSDFMSSSGIATNHDETENGANVVDDNKRKFLDTNAD
jgi:hypothetical protein